MIIDEKKTGWLKEFLRSCASTEQDRENANDIHTTFRKLWLVVRAGEALKKARESETGQEIAEANLYEALAGLREIPPTVSEDWPNSRGMDKPHL